MNTLAWAAVGVVLVATTAKAQAIPTLGAGKMIGAAGLETFSPGSGLGLPANPAAIVSDHRWSAGFGVSAGSVTDITERSGAGLMRFGRLGVGVRATSRRVENLLDDPTLEENSGLTVQDSEFGAAVAVEVTRRLRLGALGYFVSSQVLGSAGDGTGYKLGAQADLTWLSAGITYGQVETAMGWDAVNTPRFRSPATDRLSLGLQTRKVTRVPFKPQLTAEMNLDRGATDDSWLRGSLSLSLVGGTIDALAGGALSTTQRTRSYGELGLLVELDRLKLALGLRLGADPVPGNGYAFGGEIHAK